MTTQFWESKVVTCKQQYTTARHKVYAWEAVLGTVSQLDRQQ